MITYKRSKNLGELIGGHNLQGRRVFKTIFQIINGESKSCSATNKSSFCCTQVVNTKTFESYQTNRTFKIFHKISCTGSFVIYLMECTFCKIPYVGKAETPFSLRLNKNRKDAVGKNPKAIPESILFKQPGHNIRKHTKFSVIKQIDNTISIDTTKITLINREAFWRLKFDTQHRKGSTKNS